MRKMDNEFNALDKSNSLLDNQEKAPEDEHRGTDEPIVEDEELKGRYCTLKKNHPVDTIIGDPNRDVLTRLKLRDQMATLSQINPKSVKNSS